MKAITLLSLTMTIVMVLASWNANAQCFMAEQPEAVQIRTHNEDTFEVIKSEPAKKVFLKITPKSETQDGTEIPAQVKFLARSQSFNFSTSAIQVFPDNNSLYAVECDGGSVELSSDESGHLQISTPTGLAGRGADDACGSTLSLQFEKLALNSLRCPAD